MDDVDLALLQEASRVPDDLRHRVDVDQRLWDDHRLWPGRQKAALGYPSVVAQLSSMVTVRFIATGPMGDAFSDDFYTSEWGTLGAAIVSPIDEDESLIVVSMAAAYSVFTHESGSPSRYECIGSVHRLISDLARLVGRRSRVIAAGDWAIHTQAGAPTRLRSGTDARRCISRQPSTEWRRWAFATSCQRGAAATAVMS